MAKPAVIVVGADKGGVGKTTVSRALLDYFIAHNIPTRAFDTESPRGTLKRFHPDVTEVVDLTTTSDQMKIFDTLSSTDAQITVIDVRAGMLSRKRASLEKACGHDVFTISGVTGEGVENVLRALAKIIAKRRAKERPAPARVWTP